MKLHDIAPAEGSTQKKRRVGRGNGSGRGTTAGRGHKGQKSRSGYSRRPGFEGGQMPLIRRVPKRGFSNRRFRTVYAIVNVGDFRDLEGEVTPETLVEAGLVRKGMPVKVLGDGELETALTVVAHRFSRSAREKIEAAGGTCQEYEA